MRGFFKVNIILLGSDPLKAEGKSTANYVYLIYTVDNQCRDHGCLNRTVCKTYSASVNDQLQTEGHKGRGYSDVPQL